MITHEVSSPQADIITSRKQVNLFLGGVGSGKTHLAAYIAYFFVQQFPKVIGFIAANTYDQLDKSTMFRIREVWKSLQLTEYSDEIKKGVFVVGKKPPAHFKKIYDFDSYHSVVSWANGAVILLGSLDNAKSHEGKELGWAILDETKDTREQDVKDIILARMRQKGMYIVDGELTDNPEGDPFNPIYFTTSPAKVAWLNEMFELEKNIAEIEAKIYSDKEYFKKDFANKFVAISSTYHNIHNLPKNYIDNYKQNNTEERIKALIYGNPFSSSGGEFYSSFSRLAHVRKVEYDPALPIHVSFDQNTVPYSSALICQIKRDDDLWQVAAVGEVTMQNPRNSTEEVCDEILRKYGDCKFIFYYGDASGKNRSTLDKTVKHHYQIVERVLRSKLTNSSNRVLKKNPGLIARREFANKIFENKKPIRLTVDPGCQKLIADLTYIKEDIDGGKKKEKEKNRETGETYEKFGHLSDCLDYFIVSAFNDYFK